MTYFCFYREAQHDSSNETTRPHSGPRHAVFQLFSVNRNTSWIRCQDIRRTKPTTEERFNDFLLASTRREVSLFFRFFENWTLKRQRLSEGRVRAGFPVSNVITCNWSCHLLISREYSHKLVAFLSLYSRWRQLIYIVLYRIPINSRREFNITWSYSIEKCNYYFSVKRYVVIQKCRKPSDYFRPLISFEKFGKVKHYCTIAVSQCTIMERK